MNMKKSSKRIVVSTQAKNTYGFRVRTEGIDLTRYQNNPIMLWMHSRPSGKSKEEVLALGNMVDLQVEGETITALPQFDDTDDFALKIYNKVENGTYRMASAGLYPIEFKEDGEGELWLEKSELREISICDIGSNPEALAIALYDENDKMVALSDVYKKENPKTENTMKINLTAQQAKLLNLSEGKEMEATAVVASLVTLAEKQQADIATLTTEKEDAVTKLADAEKKAAEDKMTVLLTAAKEKGKITEDQVPHFQKMKFEDAEALLSTMPENKTVADQIGNKGDKNKTQLAELLKLSWDELDQANKLVTLKELSLEDYNEKFKAKFGKDPKE